MSEFDAFIQAIIENPLDDQYRLVFADFLEEHADPRAELIRIQLEMSALSRYDKRRASLRRKELKLYREHGGFGIVPAICKTRHHHGGFINSIELTIPRFLKHQDAIFASSPITELTLFGGAKKLAQLALSPYLPRLSSLRITANQASAPDVAKVISDSKLGNLKTLQVQTYNQDIQMVQALADHCPSQVLEEIDLSGIPDAIRALGESDRLPILKRLTAWAGGYSGLSTTAHEAVDALATRRPFQSLEGLFLVGPIDDQHVQRLALSPLGPTMRTLEVRSGRIVRGFQNVFPQLEELTIGNATTQLCIDVAENYQELKLLDLGWGSIGDPGAQALAASPLLKSLQRLTLTSNEITIDGVRALAESPFRAKGQKIFLRSNRLSVSEVKDVQATYGSTFGNLGKPHDYWWRVAHN